MSVVQQVDFHLPLGLAIVSIGPDSRNRTQSDLDHDLP